MSVPTVIGAVSSLNEMNAALAGVLPTKQAPMSAIGTNNCFVFMDIFLRRPCDGRVVAVNDSGVSQQWSVATVECRNSGVSQQWSVATLCFASSMSNNPL